MNKNATIKEKNIKFIRHQKGLKSEDYKSILGMKLKLNLKKHTFEKKISILIFF